MSFQRKRNQAFFRVGKVSIESVMQVYM